MTSNFKCFWFWDKVSEGHFKLFTWLSYPWILTEKLLCRLRHLVPPFREKGVAEKVSSWLYQSHPQIKFHPQRLGHQPNLGHQPRNVNNKMGHLPYSLKSNLSHLLRNLQRTNKNRDTFGPSRNWPDKNPKENMGWHSL